MTTRRALMEHFENEMNASTLPPAIGTGVFEVNRKTMQYIRPVTRVAFALFCDRERIRFAAQEALDAYEQRFGSTTGTGNFVGPIDEQMVALRSALKQ